MERKKKRNQPSCLSRYLKKKKKIYESKIKAKIKMKILKKKINYEEKKTFDKYLRLWNQLDAIVSPEYGICCSYMTLPSMWPLTFGIWPLLFLTQSPPKGATIQYRPKPVVPPVIFAGGQAYTVPGQMQGVQASEVSQHSPVCGLCVFFVLNGISNSKKETCSWCIAYLSKNYWPYWKSFVMGWNFLVFCFKNLKRSFCSQFY